MEQYKDHFINQTKTRLLHLVNFNQSCYVTDVLKGMSREEMKLSRS